MFSIETETGRLRLQCDLTIFQAAELWRSMSGAIAEQTSVEIDLAEVSEIDTAGMQLLLMLKRAAANERRELRLVNHSPAIVQALGLVDVSRLLGDPVVLSSQDQEAAL